MTTQPLTGDDLRLLTVAMDVLCLPLIVRETADYAEVHQGEIGVQALALTTNTAWVDLVNALPRLISEVEQSRSLPVEGWRMVPIEPTPEIVEAMRLCTIRNSRAADAAQPFESPWTCAVLVAPSPPSGGGI